MQVSRDRFLNQFGSTILVHARWQFHRISPPEYMPGNLFDAMSVCGGSFSVSRSEFFEITMPMIAAIHDKARKAKLKRIDHDQFCNDFYDLLSERGVEITIRPPVEAHGHLIPQRPSTG